MKETADNTTKWELLPEQRQTDKWENEKASAQHRKQSTE